MVRTRIVDMVLVATAVLLVTVCAFLVKPWVAADAVALIRPGIADAAGSGPGCASCFGSALNRLSLSPGIAWVKQDTKNGLVIVAYDSRTVKPATISAGLNRYGFANSLDGTMGIDRYCRRTGGTSPLVRPSGGCCSKIGEKGER